MSKTHVDENQNDIDAALDSFINNKKVRPAVSTIGEGVDIFGDGSEKKKSIPQRLLAMWHRMFPSRQLR